MKASEQVLAQVRLPGGGLLGLLAGRRGALAGTAGGGLWGLLIGMIFMNPLIGAVVGEGAGVISGALSDIGINDKFMKELSETMQPDNSALYVLVRKATPDKVLEQLKGFNSKVLKTSLSADEESDLRKAN